MRAERWERAEKERGKEGRNRGEKRREGRESRQKLHMPGYSILPLALASFAYSVMEIKLLKEEEIAIEPLRFDIYIKWFHCSAATFQSCYIICLSNRGLDMPHTR